MKLNQEISEQEKEGEKLKYFTSTVTSNPLDVDEGEKLQEICLRNLNTTANLSVSGGVTGIALGNMSGILDLNTSTPCFLLHEAAVYVVTI